MILNKKELMDILGVNINGLKSIEQRGQLKKRLSDKGYKLISKSKEGRNMMYEVSKKEDNTELLHNIIQYVFGTTKYKEFISYFLYRINNLDKPITQQQVADKVGVGIKTINKWDKLLVEHKILFKEGYWYIRRVEDTECITDHWEYESYRRNKVVIARECVIKNRYINGEITEAMYDMLMDSINNRKSFTDSKYVYKVRCYVRSPYTLCDDILALI